MLLLLFWSRGITSTSSLTRSHPADRLTKMAVMLTPRLICQERFTKYPHNRTYHDYQRWQQVIFCKSKSSHKSFPCKSKSSHKSFPCKSKSSHKSIGQTSSQVKSQVIWSKHKSSHKSLCPSTSQVAHYFFHSRHKKGNIIKSKRR